MASAKLIPTTKPKVTLIAYTTMTDVEIPEWSPDGASTADLVAELAGRNCYQSWSNPANRTNREYIQNILAQNHLSVVEHASFTVLLEGVSRSLTHELVRHRHMSFSQLSQRYFDESNHNIVIPPLYANNPKAQWLLAEVDEFISNKYEELLALGNEILPPHIKGKLRRKLTREAARAVLPNMVETKIVVTANHRTWREFFEKRGSIHADQEIRALAIEIFQIASHLAPNIYQDFEIITDPETQTKVLQRREGPEE